MAPDKMLLNLIILLLGLPTVLVSSQLLESQAGEHSSSISGLSSESDSWKNGYDKPRLPFLTVDDAQYIRRALAFVPGLDNKQLGSILSAAASADDDALLFPVDLIDRIESFDVVAFADYILATDAKLATVMRLLQKARTATVKDSEAHQVELSSIRDLISKISKIDFPWVPRANLSECSAAYSQYVDPKTNRVWNVVRAILIRVCTEILAPERCQRIIPPVPDATLPTWARGMFDALGKIPAGIQEGKFYLVGAYDLCNSLEIDNYTSPISGKPVPFDGQYCRLPLFRTYERANNRTIPIQLGVCTPSICSRKQVIDYYYQDNQAIMYLLRFLDISIPQIYCGQELDSATDIGFQVSTGFVVGIVALTIVATVYDGCFRKRRLKRYLESLHPNEGERVVVGKTPQSQSELSSVSSDTSPEHSSDDVRANSYELIEDTERKIGTEQRLEIFLLGFSAYTNLRKIFTTHSRPNEIPVLNGIRYLSFVWTVLGGSYVFGPFLSENYTSANIISALKTLPQEFKMQVVINFTIAGDSFLLISGILITYWFLKRFEAEGSRLRVLTLVVYAVRRYWRVMPGMMMILLFLSTTSYYLADGPLFPYKIADYDNCRVYWWRNLLMISNLLFDTEEYCVVWLTLVPVIFQLQIGAIFVLILLALKPIAGYALLTVAYIAHIAVTAVISNDIRTSGQFGVEGILKRYLFAPWCRAGPFIIGLALGIVLHKKRKIKMNLIMVLTGWIVALGTMGAVVFSSYSEFKDGSGSLIKNRWSAGALTAYDTLARSAWAVAVGWVILACHYGYGGVITTFLSWKLYLPLSRMVYSMLLPLAPMLYLVIYKGRQLYYIDSYQMLYLIAGHIVILLLVGLVVALVFDYPLSHGFERTVLSRSLLDWFRSGRHPHTVKKHNVSDRSRISMSPQVPASSTSDIFRVQDEPNLHKK